MSEYCFNILQKQCENSFAKFSHDVTIEQDISQLDEIEQRRIGFYYFILEKVTGITDYKIIDKMLVDRNYNGEIHGTDIDDNGVDAIFISDDNKTVSLFNFKYSDSFDPNSSQKRKELEESDKFLTIIKTNSTDNLSQKLKFLTDETIKRINDPERVEYTYNLYFVTSDEKTLLSDKPDELQESLNYFSNNFGFMVKLVALSNLPKLFGLGHEKINGTFVINKNDMISSLKIDNKKACIFVIPASDLLKITCNDEAIRNSEKLSSIDSLKNVKMIKHCLYDNVRYYLEKSKYNKGISNTISSTEKSKKFFLFNNGVTMICREIKPTAKNMKLAEINIKDLQVVNGGQTLKTLFKFASQGENLSNLKQANILLRVFETAESNGINVDSLARDIAEYTNSQNSVNEADLKSSDSAQLDIEQLLNLSGISYQRKKGTVDDDDSNFKYSIDSVVLGQILWSIGGNPYDAVNKKSKIFGTEYKNIFVNNPLFLKIPSMVLKYIKLINDKELKKYNFNKKITRQECLYLLYTIFNYEDVDDLIAYKQLKGLYKTFRKRNKDDSTCDRPFIKKVFFDFWDGFLKRTHTAKSR